MKIRNRLHKLSIVFLSLLVMLTILSSVIVHVADELTFLVDDAGLVSSEDAASIESQLTDLAQK